MERKHDTHAYERQIPSVEDPKGSETSRTQRHGGIGLACYIRSLTRRVSCGHGEWSKEYTIPTQSEFDASKQCARNSENQWTRSDKGTEEPGSTAAATRASDECSEESGAFGRYISAEYITAVLRKLNRDRTKNTVFGRERSEFIASGRRAFVDGYQE